ncbi:MAG: peptidylprolyl isomerase [Syntrophomonas sp.]
MLKSRFWLLLIMALLITGFTCQTALGEDRPIVDTRVSLYPGTAQISVIDKQVSTNQMMDVAPYIQDGFTMIPVRGVLQALGATVNWIQDTRQIEVTSSGTHILLTVNSNNALINDRSVVMDKPVQIINNRTMIPIRFVAENLGCVVKWDGAQNRIDIINKTIASAKGVVIGYGEFDKAMAWTKYRTEKQYGPGMWTAEAENGKTWAEVFPQIVLNEIVVGEIVEAEALAQNIQVPDDEINNEIAKYQKLINEDKDLAKVVKQYNIGDSFLRGMARESLFGAKYKSNYTQSIKITDNEIKAYYDVNKSTFTAEKVKASHILIKTRDDSTQEGKDYNQAAYQKASQILRRAQAGEDFATLARQYSEDSGTAPNGGDLGYFPKGVMVKEFEQAAFALNKGQISDLVKSIYGYHIIKVEDHTTVVSSYDQVKETIKNLLMENKVQENIKALAQDADVKVYGLE